jgi:sorbitol-specific phosphotransferase system component IIBC
MTDELQQEKIEQIKSEQTQAFNPDEQDKNNKKVLIIAIVIGVLVIAGIVVSTIFLVKSGRETTEQVRDIFIIFMALTSLILGVALVILIAQLAILINLVQNEIRPILESTTETVNTLKGTTQFISDNLTEPVIKLNQYLAMFKQLIKPSKK